MKNEKDTRKLIDDRLHNAGWNTSDLTQVVKEFDILLSPSNHLSEPVPAYSAHQFSDYVLLGKNGKPIAVVEAKKTWLGIISNLPRIISHLS